MELAGNDKFVDALQDTGNPYIEIRVRNDDGADSPLHKTADGIELLVNALMADFYIGKEGRPDIFLTSLDYQINNLLCLRNTFFSEMYKEDTDDGTAAKTNIGFPLPKTKTDDTPVPDAFKNAFD